jgi:1,4-alpha-glucan branching enzyme
LGVAAAQHGKVMGDLSGAKTSRRLPIGAEVLADGEMHFRVWAPLRQKVEVIIEGPRANSVVEFEPEPNGYFSTWTTRTKPGDLYRYRLDRSEVLISDPASRFQPEGPLSCISHQETNSAVDNVERGPTPQL